MIADYSGPFLGKQWYLWDCQHLFRGIIFTFKNIVVKCWFNGDLVIGVQVEYSRDKSFIISIHQALIVSVLLDYKLLNGLICLFRRVIWMSGINIHKGLVRSIPISFIRFN